MEQKYYENNSKKEDIFQLFITFISRFLALLVNFSLLLSLLFSEGGIIFIQFIKTPVEYRFLIKKEDDSEDESGDELEDDSGEEFENQSDLDSDNYSSEDNNVENDSNNEEEDSFFDHFYFES